MNVETHPAPALHQLVPVLSVGDAISDYVRWIRDCLRDLGYQSDIYVEAALPAVLDQVILIGDQAIPGEAGVIYHHCIGTPLSQLAARHAGPKTMIYHNITPPEFFQPYNPAFAEILRQGRDGLPDLAADYQITYGDSAYNVSELEQAGFKNCQILPIPVSADRWTEEPDDDLMTELDDGKSNILFVGRVAPNKSQHHLVEAFYHYLCMDPKARLLISGVADPNDRFAQHVQSRIVQLGLGSTVSLLGHVSQARLLALYRSADLLWSMSEHEGFCIPLLEAMWFDIPVLAYNSSAVPETLGQAGLIFDDKSDLKAVAAIAKRLVHDKALRDIVLKAQRQRRLDFLPATIRPKIVALAERLVPLKITA
jgi:glycosyltransferase involved in cell wall biosynthesis